MSERVSSRGRRGPPFSVATTSRDSGTASAWSLTLSTTWSSGDGLPTGRVGGWRITRLRPSKPRHSQEASPGTVVSRSAVHAWPAGVSDPQKHS